MTSVLNARPTTRRRSGTAGAPPQRLDIQGLRMVAVMLVVLDHLFGWPRGGFIGVDVFFVISGFLITGILLDQVEKTGRVSFSGFYRKRIRRIIPSATLVLVVTIIAAYVVFGTGRGNPIATDALWAFLFAANWRFAVDGTDYFTANGPVSPIQHYWSLSVEEQFYFVWPVVILVIGLVVARKAWGTNVRHGIAAAVMGAIVAASFAWAVLETGSEPTWAYFSTFSRVWELGVGALLAIGAANLARIPDAVRPFIAWTGLAFIAAGAFLITEDVGFPAPWAAVPVIGSAMVIAANIGGRAAWLQPLTNKAGVYVGNLSYTLYLWHWPVIVILAAILPTGPRYYAACILLAAGLTALTFHLYEDPIRHRKRPSFRAPGPGQTATAARAAVIALALIVGGVGVWATGYIPTGPATAVQRVDLAKVAAASPADTNGGSEDAAVAALQTEISEAINATAWPENADPALSTLASTELPFDVADGCAPATPNGRDCAITGADPSKLAVVVGNSIAVAYLPAIRAALEPAGWRVEALTYVGCPLVEGDTINPDATVTRTCPAHKDIVVDILEQTRPALVIGASSNDAKLSTPVAGGSDEVRFANALDAMVTRIAPFIGTYVHVATPPRGKDPAACATQFSTPSSCLSDRPGNYAAAIDAQKAVMDKPGRRYVDTIDWFCVRSKCPLIVGNTIVRFDDSHITPQYGQVIAPLLQRELFAQSG